MGKTVIVGDVHGCRLELEQLLEAVAFTSGDRLIFVGDLIARGPDSLGVLDVARRTGAIIVRGNHEEKLIVWRKHPNIPLGRIHLEVAQSLRDVDWTLLETSPFWFDVPEHGGRIIHAGVLPGLPIEKQDPQTLLHIRSVSVKTVKTRTVRGSTKKQTGAFVRWGALYEGPPHIVFGHNALGGLQLHPWATGLDTGCVYGGRLTAMVLAEGQKIPRSMPARQRCLHSVPAQRVYFAVNRRVVA
jgi:Calcineurin-like phosphoesterase